jgi:hypothetical protein
MAKKTGLTDDGRRQTARRQIVVKPDKRWRGKLLLRQGYDVCGE